MNATATQVEGRPGQPGRPETLLRVTGATKDFPGQRALDDMSFDVLSGEVHALLGENGAGKSTLIKAVSGAITLNAGSVQVCGTDLPQGHTPQEAIDAGLSVVYQHGNLVPNLTVTENVLLSIKLPRKAGIFVDMREANAKTRVLLDRVGLQIDPKTPTSELTPHQAALVAIAKALALDSRLIFLDEPTSALLPAEVNLLFDQMRKLTQEGIGFVFVTHRLAEVFKISDRITVMRDGKLIGTWARSELDQSLLVDEIVGPEKSLAESFTPDASKVGEPIVLVRELKGRVLQGIAFEVRKGEVLGVASLPGEGAEEVISALYGMTRSSGQVEVNGSTVDLRSPNHAISSGFALVPRDRHEHAVVPELSVKDNILLASGNRFVTDPVLRFVRRKSASTAASEVADELRVKTASLDAAMSSLSGGNQQKAVLSRWVLGRADVYLLDSPTAAVDVHAKSEIYTLIRGLADQGSAVIFTSTEIEEFARVCDRVIVLADGRIQGEVEGDDRTVASIMRLSFGRDKDE